MKILKSKRDSIILVALSPSRPTSSALPYSQFTSSGTTMAKLLANKVVVITGSSQGLGRATAIGKHATTRDYTIHEP